MQLPTIGIRKKLLMSLAALGVSSLVATGGMGWVPAEASEMPGAGKTVQPITTGRADHYFQHFVVQITLEKLGYKVNEHLEAQFPAMHLALGQGEADYTAVHWDPLHKKFYEEAGGEDKLVRVGNLIEDAQQGYLIDKATAEKYGINNISQLSDPEVAKHFDADGDGKADLSGCNPGWGCERVIEHHLDEYGLRSTIQHNQGAYFALIADTITRFEAGEPIFYYTWTPLWVSSVLKPGIDTTWLNVPFSSLPDNRDADTSTPDGRNPGFEVNTIKILANKEFLSNNPAAKRLFELMSIPISDVNAAILRQHEGEKDVAQIRKHAEEWVESHADLVNGWVADAAAAAN